MSDDEVRKLQDRLLAEYRRYRKKRRGAGEAAGDEESPEIPEEIEALLPAVAATLVDRMHETLTVGPPESVRQKTALSAILRRHLGLGLIPPPVFTVIRLTPAEGTGFCRVKVGRDLAFSMEGPGARRGSFSLRDEMALVETDEDEPIRVESLDGNLIIGICPPASHKGPLRVSGAAAERAGGRISLYIQAEARHRLDLDRMRWRPWQRLDPGNVLGPRSPALLPDAWTPPDYAEEDEDRLFAPDHAVLREESPFDWRFVHLPITLFDDAEPWQLLGTSGPRAIWFTVPWPEGAEATASHLSGKVYLNCSTAWNLVYLRVDPDELECLDDRVILVRPPAGLSVSDAGAVVHSVRDEARGIRYYDRRHVLAVSLPHYDLVSSEREGVLLEVRIQDPGARVTLSYSVYTRPEMVEGFPPHDVHSTTDLNPAVGQIQSSDSLEETRIADVLGSEEDVWHRFHAYLGGGTSVVTKRDFRHAIASFPLFGLNRKVRSSEIRMEARHGRLRGASLPFLDIVIPLRDDAELGERDKRDCLAALSRSLESRTHANCRFRLRFE